ncbi:MAG: hypothetical protein RMY16_13270 [Nostoc sp. DedQUE12b]|uniref:hypothetical protein n=1 Tax=Nostoc sp. DedQUE12b TaxID=3075398 RepID=UPI002AD3EEB2|nr:hypothetical protein [Nostoc sp. DedQUE12b]MDZ8086509.1 hypothetical protein [Nostoc sp. DedQUE12b]
MALPTNFSEFEHLQDTVRLAHNKAVRAYFKNQADDDISTPKASLKHACLMKDEDSAVMTQMRSWLFEITIGHAQSLQAPIYGIPVQELQRESKFRPQIKLYFKEPYDFEKHGDGTEQVRGEIGFRIMNKTADTISRADAVGYAREIKAEFATPPLIWKKGKYKCTYLDLDNGFDLRLLCLSKTEGESTVKSVLKILDKTYSDNNFQFIENTKEFPTNPGTHRVYGRTVKKFRQRPTAEVKFTHAQLLIPGQVKPVNLVGLNGRLRSAIENVTAP